MTTRGKSGFTLIEVMVSAVLLGIGITAALGALRHSVLATRRAEEYSLAAILAQSKLEEAKLLASQGLTNDRGDFSPDYPDIQWEQEVIEGPESNLDQVTIRIIWTSSGQEQTYELTTYLYVPPSTESGGTLSGNNP